GDRSTLDAADHYSSVTQDQIFLGCFQLGCRSFQELFFDLLNALTDSRPHAKPCAAGGSHHIERREGGIRFRDSNAVNRQFCLAGGYLSKGGLEALAHFDGAG